MARMTITGFGQVEINNVAGLRSGNIEAQCALDTGNFSASVPCENGMILAVDAVSRKVKFAAASETLPVALVYTAEHQYDETKTGLKDFRTIPGEFYPRLVYLITGDKFTTNCICYSTSDYATNSALISALDSVATTPVYATYSTEGAISISASLPTTGLKLEVVKRTTMPDGTIGVQFRVM